MPELRNEDVLWYVATRRDSGAHWILNENYMEDYQDEFERIREFEDVEDAKVALEARKAADLEMNGEKFKEKKKLRVSKIRGDVRKGSLEDEELRSKIRAELEAELKAKMETKGTVKTPSRTTKPTKAPVKD